MNPLSEGTRDICLSDGVWTEPAALSRNDRIALAALVLREEYIGTRHAEEPLVEGLTDEDVVAVYTWLGSDPLPSAGEQLLDRIHDAVMRGLEQPMLSAYYAAVRAWEGESAMSIQRDPWDSLYEAGRSTAKHYDARSPRQLESLLSRAQARSRPGPPHYDRYERLVAAALAGALHGAWEAKHDR